MEDLVVVLFLSLFIALILMLYVFIEKHSPSYKLIEKLFNLLNEVNDKLGHLNNTCNNMQYYLNNNKEREKNEK